LILEATHQPISKLLSNEIDIAIVTTQPDNETLTSISVYEDEIFVLLHKEHHLHNAPHIEASDFINAHLIIHSLPLETVSIYKQFLKPNNSVPQKITPIPLTEVALEMVLANMGIICLPKWSLKPFKIPRDIIYKSISKNGLKRIHYLVVRKADKNKKYINDFIANFLENFQD